MWELLIMRELLSGRSWTSKVFNTLITLDTYQFTKHKSYVHSWDLDFLSCKTYMTPILRPTRLQRLLAMSGSVITTDILLLH